MKHFLQQSVAVCLALFLVGSLSGAAYAQEGAGATSHFFADPVETSEVTLDRISELSELYIFDTITPEELAELKQLAGNDLSDLDGYKAEYAASQALIAEAAAGTDDYAAPPSNRTGNSDAPQSSGSSDQPLLTILVLVVFFNLLLTLYIMFRKRHV